MIGVKTHLVVLGRGAPNAVSGASSNHASEEDGRPRGRAHDMSTAFAASAAGPGHAHTSALHRTCALAQAVQNSWLGIPGVGMLAACCSCSAPSARAIKALDQRELCLIYHVM